MKYIIDKSFSFCYGHRVHNQRLDTKFTESGDACLACRHLHGHEGLVKVFLEEDTNSTNVKDTGMVTDFKHLGWFKNFLDDTLDHKFIMDLQDPLFDNEFELCAKGTNTIKMENGYSIPDLTYVQTFLDNSTLTNAEQSAIFEKYEGAIFVDFVPTSENLSGWLLSVVQEKMKDLPGINVKAVEYWETPKSHCRVES
jgi:6-pyruvoyltetrahydropterin/6-carboxytetrahydropterin synthase